MPLWLDDIAKESETISFDAFVTFFIEVVESLIAGSSWLFINDFIVFFSDFEDGANDILVDHGVDILIDVVH